MVANVPAFTGQYALFRWRWSLKWFGCKIVHKFKNAPLNVQLDMAAFLSNQPSVQEVKLGFPELCADWPAPLSCSVWQAVLFNKQKIRSQVLRTVCRRAKT